MKDMDNLKHAFAERLLKIKDAHVLIVDDVVTTGATICSLGQELRKVEGVKISVVSVGFANEQR